MGMFHVSWDAAAVMTGLSIPVSSSLRSGNEDEKLCGHFIWLRKTAAVIIVHSHRSFSV